MDKLTLICETEEEREIRERLEGKGKPLTITQTMKFYSKYGMDWAKKFYKKNISIYGLPQEQEEKRGEC
jgi:hypothetical protein